MSANANDGFVEVGNPGSATTLSAPGYTIGDATITVVSTTNWPTATGVVFAIDVIGADGMRVDGSYNVYQGTVATATSITNVSHIAGTGTDRNYTAGTTTRVYIIVASEISNRLARALAEEHNQDGTHGAVTADSIVTTGNVTIGGTLTIGGSGSAGWEPITGTITAVTANGNRSYDLTTSADNTGLISPGMRARSTRTVAAPTQCTSLNGTTQYYSKTTPAGMTFTDDFVAGAWIKLSSYATGVIISRTSAINGWILRVNSDGTVEMYGTNTLGSNYRAVKSYQSVPLNKLVYVTAQLDMSAHTATPTTSYVMFDGTDVPAQVTQNGTNPTALIQAGDLQVGAANGSGFFPGKIAQAFVSSAKITQANIKTLYSQGLTAGLISSNSIISAYSFDNSITDLNTTNANNLTANGSAVATNADSPFGGQADGTISSTLDYGIIQKVTASTITVQVAEGCTIPTSGGVSSLSYATVKSPYGFPAQEGKWQIVTTCSANTALGIGALNTNYDSNLRITAPVGSWEPFLNLMGYASSTTSVSTSNDGLFWVALTSSATSTIPGIHLRGATSSTTNYSATICGTSVAPAFDVTTATSYSVWYKQIAYTGGAASMAIRGDLSPMILTLTNAYL